MPIPEGVTPDQLRALSALDEEAVARLAELDGQASTGVAEPAASGPARLAELEPGS
ncbi:hypothetical protein [Streptomyces fungicidicus]|uniref:hypothetical protein n=1 Tax=Streptomyces fungicidicus TaxID=68203 RepID=UPI003D73276F